MTIYKSFSMRHSVLGENVYGAECAEIDKADSPIGKKEVVSRWGNLTGNVKLTALLGE